VTILFVVIAVFGPMIAESVLSARHERELLAAGAREPGGDVYKLMRFAYPGAFLLVLAEGIWREAPPAPAFWAGAFVFAAAKALKYWAIAHLGVRWTFRVLVPPQSSRVVSGPYRWLRHPNYIAVAGELSGAALMSGARVTGPVATLGFVVLMVLRVKIEERALMRT